MNEKDLHRWKKEQMAFCKTFILSLPIGALYILFCGMLMRMIPFTFAIQDPLIFVITDVILAFIISVVAWEQYKRKVRKYEGKQL